MSHSQEVEAPPKIIYLQVCEEGCCFDTWSEDEIGANDHAYVHHGLVLNLLKSMQAVSDVDALILELEGIRSNS